MDDLETTGESATLRVVRSPATPLLDTMAGGGPVFFMGYLTVEFWTGAFTIMVLILALTFSVLNRRSGR